MSLVVKLITVVLTLYSLQIHAYERTALLSMHSFNTVTSIISNVYY